MHPDFIHFLCELLCALLRDEEIMSCLASNMAPERPHHTLIGFGAMGVSQSATLSWFLRSKKMEAAMDLSKTRVERWLALNPRPSREDNAEVNRSS